ncbi:MAG: thioredoxin-disulfide reductase [Thermoprotei archaeon]|nr:MAG: thioredoxin-disulfide reductase [Thermoprotei archaeon]
MSVKFKLETETFKLTLPTLPTTEKRDYDLVIVGGGPAGLTAAIYGARYGLDVAIITKLLGGYMTEATIVDDYPGLPDISGHDLVDKFVSHVKKYDVPIVIDEVVNIFKDKNRWIVETRLGKRYTGYAVIIAVGSEKRKLGIPGENKFIGRGVSYCATCDGPLFKGKVVAVVGGGNSALISALYLAKICSRVILIHRRDQFRAFPLYVEEAKKNPKIKILTNTIVTEILGDNRLGSIKIKNAVTGEERILEVDGLFIEIGLEPPIHFFKKIGLELDETGHVITKPDMSTNLPGVYVAGDAAGGPCKYRFEQIIVAAAEGAKAADAAFKYILQVKKE